MENTIVLETFKLPEFNEVEKAEYLYLNDMIVTGKVILPLPIGKINEKKFIQSFYKNCDSSEMMILRQILESNRRYSAADTAYIYQKKRECEESKNDLKISVLTPSQRRMTRISYYLGGNGMRPSYTLGWLLITTLLFASIMITMGINNPHNITGNMILDDIYLSASSLILGGMLDIRGIGLMGYIICLIEGIIGLLLMLYFTVILTRKMIR